MNRPGSCSVAGSSDESVKGANATIHHAAVSFSWIRPPRKSLRRSFRGNWAPATPRWPPSGVARSSPGAACSSCRRPRTSVQSRQSALTVRTHRSAKAFARGVRNGVLTTSTPSEPEHLIEGPGELRVPVADEDFRRLELTVDGEVPGLLVTQADPFFHLEPRL